MSRPTPEDFSDERSMLLAFLDFQRKLARHRLTGLTEGQAKTRLVPSLTTPAGIISHLAAVERFWFLRVLDGQDWRPPWTKDDPNAEWRVRSTPLPAIMADYRAAIAEANEAIDRHQLEDHARARRDVDQQVTMRWILVHMIAETAQHNGHLDILREQLDADAVVSA
ncbi:MAG: hypothetical protein QG597_713 [Actinomycetota bacterium]|nr:hypothetical protein [Actinomycetota bacterium]